MEITVQLNRDDYKEFTRYVLENKKISRLKYFLCPDQS